jgi:IS605 OrfB family transposase
MRRTLAVVLAPNPALSETIRQCNDCCNFFLRLGFAQRTYSKRRLQSLGYYAARARWPRLQASLVQGARDCAADMLQREKLARLPRKKPASAIRYNQRTFKAFLERGTLSLSTVEGRRRVPLRIARYFDRYRGGDVVALRVRHDHGLLRADLIVDVAGVSRREVGTPRVVGLDRGIVNAAVLSTGQFFRSKRVRAVRGRYAFNRRWLQAAGTRSAKRHLRCLRGRERRFQADVNHCIAKRVAALAFDVLALEDLRVRPAKRLGKEFNRRLGGWAHAQLEAFLAYKLEEVGKRLVKVPAAYTSRRCSRCGNVGLRTGSRFRCPVCGLRLHADLNAARNIAYLGRTLVGRSPVNGPIVAGGETEPSRSVEPSYKPPISMGGS